MCFDDFNSVRVTMMIRLLILLTLTVHVLELAAEQPDVFEVPVRLTYGDPEIIAPMMGPAMTFDWDRDGRMDLVGRNHWWPEQPKWWRNTGEKHDGMTLFELGGDADIDDQQYGSPSCTMIGDLDGDGVADTVVGNGNGYQWFADTTTEGIRRFEKRGMFQAALGGDLPHPEKGEEVPCAWLADFDGDGRTDMLVGTRSVGLPERYLPQTDGIGFGRGWIDGSWLARDVTATVWLHRNVGDDQNPSFTHGSLVRTEPGGRAITFFDRAEPVVADFDGDGKPDLLVGALDRVVLFLNKGEPGGAPRLDGGHALTFDGLEGLPYQNRTLFAFRDEDGLMRLRLGGPIASETVQLNKKDPFAFGPVRSIPFRNAELRMDDMTVTDATDWDGDGKIDLIVGGQDGWIWFFKNIDPTGGPGRWAPPQWVQADGHPINLGGHESLQGPVEWMWGHSNPTVEDWDLDGDLDLICGSMIETYVWFENIGSRKEPKLTSRGPLRYGDGEGEPVSTAWRTRPGVGDLDGDGLPDLVSANGHGHLSWWRRYRDDAGDLRLAPAVTVLAPDGDPFVVTGHWRHTGRTKIVVCDWDHDGRSDIMCSPPITQNDQFFFLNQGIRDGKLVMKRDNHRILLRGVSFPPFTHYAMCEPVDFDGDGVWEVVAGFDRGYIYYWKE
jgi:hypothetical protein